jgi:AcrR family transcriptional regulator
VGAARDAFAQRGYRATSLRDIAAAAGISHPGLLRHFPTKDALLAGVVASLEAENARAMIERPASAEPGSLGFSERARRNRDVPGYLALFAALQGEASTPAHPAHELMRARYARLVELSTLGLQSAIARGVVAPDRDPHAESVRGAAAWDGLQLLEQYAPDRVDVVAALQAHERLLGLPVGWRDDIPRHRLSPHATHVMQPAAIDEDPAVGYRVGRERRARILADAMRLYADEGYGDTSLRDVAERVGVSKSTLMHYYPSKEALLGAVLRERDRRAADPSSAGSGRASDQLRAVAQSAARDTASAPGLVQVYAVLSCEAVPADHPAHAYFAERFRAVLDRFQVLFEAARADGDLPAHRDPAFEAVWLVALWDGLQHQWLYDPRAVDVAAQLAAHLDDVLPR